MRRLQPELEGGDFPWDDDQSWQSCLGDPVISKKYLDVVYESLRKLDVGSQHNLVRNAYLPDRNRFPQPLASMFGSVALPPDLGNRRHVSILHPVLSSHRLLTKRTWKPKPYSLDNYLDDAQLEASSHEERRSFWNWLRQNHVGTLRRLADLPIWPSSSGDLLKLNELCQPRNARIKSIFDGFINRPSDGLFRARIIKRKGRGKLVFRSDPNFGEIKQLISATIGQWADLDYLDVDERKAFIKFESSLVAVAANPKLRASTSAKHRPDR